jgi:hypothetical protein
MTLTIAVISIVISSVALAGVAVSLLFQARQLKVSQLQATWAAQLELMKMALDNPAVATNALGIADPEIYTSQVFLNWHIKYLELGYEIKAISALGVREAAKELFGGQFARDWWSWNRQSYESATTTTQRTKQFFTIIDAEYQRLKTTPISSNSRSRHEGAIDETRAPPST